MYTTHCLINNTLFHIIIIFLDKVCIYQWNSIAVLSTTNRLKDFFCTWCWGGGGGVVSIVICVSRFSIFLPAVPWCLSAIKYIIISFVFLWWSSCLIHYKKKPQKNKTFFCVPCGHEKAIAETKYATANSGYRILMQS